MPIWSPAFFGSGASSDFVIEDSVWFDGTGGADVLQRTPFVAGTSNKKFVLAGWMKCLTDTPANYTLVGNTGAADNTVLIWGNDTGSWRLRWTNSISTVFQTGDLSRDPTAWLHWCLAVDTTQSTDTNRVKFYLNGTEVNNYGSTSYPAQDATTLWNSTTTQEIHQAGGPPMILAQLVNLDGQSIVGGDLAITDLVGSDRNGVPIPVDVSGLTYGTNGWLLNFDQSGLLGASSNSSTNPTVSFLGSDVQGLGSTHTVSNATLGTAASNRSIVIAAGGARNNAGTRTATCTVGGVTATEIVRSFGTNPNCLYFFIIDVPSNTEADIVVSYSGGNNNMDASGIAWWRVLDAGQPISISTANADGWSSLPITNIGQSGDVTLYGLFDSGNVTAFNWSDATERADHSNIRGSSTTFLSFTAADYSYTSGESHTETVTTASGSGNETSFAAITLSNNNSFASTSLAAANQITDTPTDDAETIGNYVTWNSVDKDSNVTLSEGNTVAEQDSNTSFKNVFATQVVPSSGKWVWEIKQSGGQPFAGYATTGVASTDVSRSIGRSGSGAITFDYQTSSNKIRKFGGGTTEADYATSVSMSSGEAFQFAIDSDAEELEIFVNNTQEGSTLDISSLTKPYKIISQIASNGTVDHTLVANSADFENNVPTGYKTINTANLPAPTVKDPDDGYVQVLDTGANIQSALATARSGYSTYMEVFKDLDSTTIWQVRFSDDTSNGLDFESTAAKTTFAAPSGSNNFLGWAFNMNATHGMFTAEVSHTNGSDTNTAHSLGAGLKMAVVKITNTTGAWYWRHPGMTSGYNIEWNQHTTGEQNSKFYADIDDTNVIVKSAAPTGTYRVIAIVEVEGFSSLATMVGNGSADGPFVYTGMQPEFMMCRRHTGGVNTFAYVRQGHNPENTMLEFDDPGGTSVNTGADKDWCANGFKQRTDSNDFNQDTVRNFFWSIGRPFGGSGVAQAKAR